MASRLCSRCQAHGLEGQRFCAQCGAPLAARPQAKDAAEYRQLTIIFSDIADSTRLTDTLGAESYREMLRDYRERAARCFRKFEGYIANYFGDGTLVYFGYPNAHEDDAWRAVQASLELQGSLKETNRAYLQGHGVDLRVRVAVHTGTVVAGDIWSESASETMAIIGNAPNIAARLQELGEPGTVTISDATYRLVQHAFRCRPRGEVALKGLSRPVAIFHVDGPTKWRSRWAPREQAAPLVGRDQPVRALAVAWEGAQAGPGGVVLISGEAGVGKTRLVAELMSGMDKRAARRIIWRCSPLHENTALHPLMQYLSFALGITELQSGEEKFRRLERGFGSDEAARETIPLLAPLLGLTLPPEQYPPLGLSPQQERERLHRSLIEWLQRTARERPVLLVVEDIHWADPSTLELLSKAAPHVGDIRVLMVLTSRNEDAGSWIEQAKVPTITLRRLEDDEAQTMIRLLAQGQGLPDATIRALVAKTDGVPLFIEEMTRGVIEAELTHPEGRSSHDLVVPATLQESLAGRIDRAAVDRRILQLSATLGREFSFDVLAAVCGAEQQHLRNELDKLVTAGLVQPADVAGSVRYTFRHALIQDAIYHFQLSGPRQSNHEHIAYVLARDFPAICARSPELVANHHLQTRNRSAALPFLRSAAEMAIRRSAHVEASNYLQQALEIVRRLPATPECERTELSLLASLGVVLSARKGFAAEETGAAFARARELCRSLGRAVELFPVLHGLYRFYFVRGKLHTASDLSREMLSIAREQVDPALLLEAHRAAGNCRFLAGQYIKANRHFGRTLALYQPDLHNAHRFDYGTDALVVAAGVGGLSAYLSGDPEQGLDLMARAVEMAEELEHPYSICWALALACVLHQIAGDIARVDEYSQRQLASARHHGFALWELAPLILLGWCASVRQGGGAGIAQMRKAIEAWRTSGSECYLPYHLSLLASAYLRDGEPARAQLVLEEALRTADGNGELWWKSELLRLRGHCTLASAAIPGARAEAEPWFREALATARRQRATKLVERAESDLNRLIKAERMA